MLGEQIDHALEIFKYCKSISDVPTVWGGSQGSISPLINIKHPAIDYVIQGDGEESFRMLVEHLKNTPNKETNIPGVFSKTQIRPLPHKQVILDHQPMPSYDLLPNIKEYTPNRFGKPTIDIETSRGCPFNCSFCYNPQLQRRKWRSLSENLVKERINYLSKKYRIDSFWFIDDEFFVDLKRAESIMKFMLEKNFAWSVQGTTIKNCLKMEDTFLQLLYTSGCKQLNIGVESGSEELLKSLHKPITNNEVLEVNRKLKRNKIVPSFYFVVGFPTETLEDLDLTLDLINRILKENKNAKIMNIGCYTPYPSTELLQTCLEHGYVLPQTLEEYSSYGVDDFNTPWVLNDPETLKRIKGACFTNYFLDNKVNDLEVPFWINVGSKLYSPIAKWRFRHKFFGIPLDIDFGTALKDKLYKGR